MNHSVSRIEANREREIAVTAKTATARKPFIQSREDAEAAWFFGGRTWIRASAETTEGKLGVVEQIMDPGTGSPYHIHHNEDEEFYVIEGQIRFISEGQSWIAGPGAFALLPRDVPHGFEVVSDSPARILLMVTPAGFEGFVADLWEPAPAPPDMAKVMPAAAKYGLEILGPLPE
jgi:quercetin dioxygenase-like cupin family protein